MSFWRWSRTAASDATADPSINWAEGMSPSGVNDSGRAMMAAAAKYRDDIAGAIVTGGTSTAYTVASYQVFDTLAHLDGAMIAFTPHTTNGQTVTLNVDGLGAKALRSAPSAELQAGTLIEGTPYVATYNNSDAAWYLQNFYGNPYNVPLAGGMDYWGATVPNSSFAFPAGQEISRTIYATLFAIMGTTHGTGDGSTTFNLPDKTGRVSAMKEAAGARLTSTYFGGNSANLGAVGGAESKTLATINLPPYTPAGTIGAITFPNIRSATVTVGGIGDAIVIGTSNGNTNATLLLLPNQSTSITGTPQGGTSTPIATVQPTIVCNYIIRII